MLFLFSGYESAPSNLLAESKIISTLTSSFPIHVFTLEEGEIILHLNNEPKICLAGEGWLFQNGKYIKVLGVEPEVDGVSGDSGDSGQTAMP